MLDDAPAADGEPPGRGRVGEAAALDHADAPVHEDVLGVLGHDAVRVDLDARCPRSTARANDDVGIEERADPSHVARRAGLEQAA